MEPRKERACRNLMELSHHSHTQFRLVGGEGRLSQAVGSRPKPQPRGTAPRLVPDAHRNRQKPKKLGQPRGPRSRKPLLRKKKQRKNCASTSAHFPPLLSSACANKGTASLGDGLKRNCKVWFERKRIGNRKGNRKGETGEETRDKV